MHDLEHAIAEWREQMVAAGVKSGEALDELESHLREDVASQVQSGADLQEAFDAAVRRIGGAGELKMEFEKAGATRKAWWQYSLIESPEMEWKVGNTLIVVFGVMISVGMSVCVLFKLGSCSGMSLGQQIMAFGATLLIGATIGGGKLLHPLLPVVPNKRKRTLVVFAGVLFIVVEFVALFYGVLPRVVLTEAQLMVVLLWAMVPWAAMVGVGAGIEHATRRAAMIPSQN